MKPQDKIVSAVIERFILRSDAGITKYGTTLDRSDLSVDQWLTHLQEELMDATLYIEKLKQVVSSGTLCMTADSYMRANKQTIDGFLYIRISDLDILPI